MKRLSILFCLSLLTAGPAPAQQWERDGAEERRTPAFLLCEPLFVPDPLGPRVDVPYRVDMDFFIGLRARTAPADRPFLRKGEVLIELFDSTGTSAARAIEPFEVMTASGERAFGPRSWHTGIGSFRVPPGKYEVLFEVTDLQSKRNVADRSSTIEVPAWDQAAGAAAPAGKTTIGLSTPFFVRGTLGSSIPDTLRLVNAGKDYLFGDRASFFFLLNDTDTAGLQVSYALEEAGRREDAGREIRKESSVPVLTRSRVTLKPASDSAGVYYALVPGPGAILAAVPLPVAELPLREYRLSLTVRQGSRTGTAVRRFRALWPDMPMSLRDVDTAIDLLRFLAPEEQVDRIRGGGFEERRDSLEAFWKARDTTPETAYNELMAEYYRRVDHAMRTYGTLRQPDGSRTDRGRIFILYGPPSGTERMLNPAGAYREVWKYERLGRTFVFEDQNKTGNYVLVPPTKS